jgi:hypothetical protein
VGFRLAVDPTVAVSWRLNRLAGCRLDASAARLHGPALDRVWIVSDPQLTAINPLI